MDEINIDQKLVEQTININPVENINIDVSQESINIDKKTADTILTLDGNIVQIEANYPQAIEAARIATEKAAEATQVVEGFDTHAQEKITEYDSNASDKIAAYNLNATEKTNAFNSNATDKTDAFNLNTTSKTSDFNSNASDKTTAFNSNAILKTGDFNDNATSKTTDFNTNASNKTDAFDLNASNKTTDFNDNTSDKTGDFNLNAQNKTSDFNDNYTEKKGLIDAQVGVAEGAATTATTQAGLAKQWAIGDPSEPVGNSAKYWAEQSQAELSGLTSRVSTIEGEIPSAASSSNQLADKDWVENKGYITGITSSDVTTALGYSPYDSSNPSGYTSNIGTVTSVNNTSPDSWGNVTISIPAAQVNSDWNASSGVAQILNKPSIPTVNNATLTITQGGTTKGTFTANAGTDVTIALDAASSVSADNKSITTNSSDELQTVGVINSRDTSTAVKTWAGTRAQYNAIVTKDADTLYNITDDTTISLSILEALYPVGSIYITTANGCPLSTLIPGSVWALVASDRVLQGASSNHNANTTIEAGLPNITGNFGANFTQGNFFNRGTGAFGSYRDDNNNPNVPANGGAYANNNMWDFDASRSSSIYGNSTTVQPPAYVVNIYQRAA